MSLSIRHITNDEKSAYVVINSGVSPKSCEFYAARDDVPESIRHYAKDGEPEYYGPDAARIHGNLNGVGRAVLDYFYPNHPNCTLPEYADRICIAELCKHAPDGDWNKCEHYPKG